MQADGGARNAGDGDRSPTARIIRGGQSGRVGVQGRASIAGMNSTLGWKWVCGLWVAAAVGCGDSGGGSDSASGTGSSGDETGGSTTAEPTTTMEVPTTTTMDEPTTSGVGACIDEAGAPVFEHEAGVISAETWTAGVHVLAGSLNVNGLLVVEPCSVIKMPDGATIRVENGGAIAWAGTAELPIRVTSAKPGGAPGDWSGVEVYASSVGPSNVIQHVTFEYGGGSIYGQLWLEGGASLEVSDSTFKDSADYGIVLEGDVELRNFAGNTLTGNAKGPIKLAPRDAGELLAGTYSPNGVEGILIEGEGVDVAQTWLAHDAPYVAPGGFTVSTENGSAGLTIAAGATIKLGDGAVIRVDTNGGLAAMGTESEPVTFTSAKSTGSPGDWGQIEVYAASADELNVFDHVIVEHGGGSIYGQVWVQGEASLAVRNSTIRASAGVGMLIEEFGEVREFMGNTLTGNKEGALAIAASGVDSLLAGTYGPNDVEGIVVKYGYVDHDALWLAHQVPYLINDGFVVKVDAGSALLEVEAGAELRMAGDKVISVQNNGGLRLAGVDGNPVKVSSSKPAPAPGDWGQIEIYESSVGPENVFAYTEIAYGGASIYGQLWVQTNAEVTLDHVTFTGGKGCDVDAEGTVNAMSSPYMTCM